MIDSLTEFQLAASIRQKIIDLIPGIQNAVWYRNDDPSANWITRGKIVDLIKFFEDGLVSLGGLPVEAHAPCGHIDHCRMAKWQLGSLSAGYWRFVLADGRSDAELLVENRLVVDGLVMNSEVDGMIDSQRITCAPCPCDPSVSAKEHAVCSFFIWPNKPESKIQKLFEVLNCIKEALNMADDMRPRSAIRENLLLGLIKIEQLMVPISADQELLKRLST